MDEGKQFLVRAYHNRLLEWDEDDPETDAEDARALLDYARSLPAATDPRASYPVHVPATKKHAARDAPVVMAWARVSIPPPSQAPPEIREHAAIQASILRVWEPDPPAGAKRVEWVLISSLPITRVEEALRAVDWYSCRWLCEDYHQCLKTGCRVEAPQLDAADDVCRLLGFLLPIAVRLLQVRQRVRQSPEVPAKAVVDPLMVDVLTIRRTSLLPTMTLGQFWRAVAELGGHQGRRSDGPPGWRTLWKGWRYLSDLTEGARLFARGSTS